MLTALTRRTAHRHLPAFVGALAVLGGLAFQPAASAEEGNLMLTPTRVVLNDKQRTTVLSLVNRGKLPTTYRISVVMRRMNTAGDLEIIETGSSVDQLAAQMVRFSPREVTLPPGVTQNVRLQIRKPADLAPGEYRTHVQFLEVPPPETGRVNMGEVTGKKSNEINFKLTQIYGVSIPVIVRHGATTAQVSFSELSVVPNPKPEGPALLSLAASRVGNRSVYGDCTVTFTGASGREEVVGTYKGLAIYTPLDRRTAQIGLTRPARELRNGRLRVSFKETSPAADKPMAEAELRLP